MLLGCLTYSHPLCVSRQNHNILWPLCATRTELRKLGRARYAWPLFTRAFTPGYAVAE